MRSGPPPVAGAGRGRGRGGCCEGLKSSGRSMSGVTAGPRRPPLVRPGPLASPGRSRLPRSLPEGRGRGCCSGAESPRRGGTNIRGRHSESRSLRPAPTAPPVPRFLRVPKPVAPGRAEALATLDCTLHFLPRVPAGPARSEPSSHCPARPAAVPPHSSGANPGIVLSSAPRPSY